MHLSAVLVFIVLWVGLATGAALTFRLIKRLESSDGPFEEGL
jgi:hypothetical protein